MPKRVLALLALALAAFIVSPALAQGPECMVEGEQVQLSEGENMVECTLSIPEKSSYERVFNVSVTFTSPQGTTLLDDQTKSVAHLPKDRIGKIGWSVNASKTEYYDVSKAFKVLWDEDIKLEIDPQTMVLNNTRTEQKYIEPIIQTDDAGLCAIMYSKATSDQEKKFWEAESNCKTYIRIIGPSDTHIGDYATDEGLFILPSLTKIVLQEGKNKIQVTATDPSGNTEKAVLVITYSEDVTFFDLLATQPEVVFACVVVFIILVGLGTIIYVKTKTKKQLKETFKEKEKEEKQSRYEYLKERKKLLKEATAKLEKKSANIGLNKEEETDKRTYENELVRIEDELLNNDDFLRDLARRASKAFDDAERGTPSSQIRKQLKEEGYTDKEIALIHKLFMKLKRGEV